MNFNVIGNGLDALFCSMKLLQMGNQVRLFSTTEMLGGHFAGYKTPHGTFDMGMSLLENDHRWVPVKNLCEFKNEFSAGLRPFLKESFDWLTSISGQFQQELVVTKLSSGQEVPDYFIADNLHFLNGLTENHKNDLLSNLESYLFDSKEDSKFHPSSKLSNPYFDSLTLPDYYSRIFGEIFFKTNFENFLNCIAPISFLKRARDHRKFWLPLYYPESIYFHLTRSPKFQNFNLPEVKFEKPHNMMTSDLINEFSRKIRGHANFKFILLDSFVNISQILGDDFKTITFLPVDQLEKVITESEKIKELGKVVLDSSVTLGETKINMIHTCIEKTNSKTVFFQEAASGLFRYSISQKIANDKESVASFEFNSSETFNVTKALGVINAMGFDTLCGSNHINLPFKPKIMRLENSDWQVLSQEFQNVLEEKLINGPVIHPEAKSFNDNLVRGLSYAAKIG
jgi:hypothetical protein